MFHNYIPTSAGCPPAIVVPRIDLKASHTWQHLPPQPQTPRHKLATEFIKHHQRSNPNSKMRCTHENQHETPKNRGSWFRCFFFFLAMVFFRFHLKCQASGDTKMPMLSNIWATYYKWIKAVSLCVWAHPLSKTQEWTLPRQWFVSTRCLTRRGLYDTPGPFRTFLVGHCG